MLPSPLRLPPGATGGSPVAAVDGFDPDVTVLATPVRTPKPPAGRPAGPVAGPDASPAARPAGAALLGPQAVRGAGLLHVLFGLVTGVAVATLWSVGPAVGQLLGAVGTGLGTAITSLGVAFAVPLTAVATLLAGGLASYYLFVGFPRRRADMQRTVAPNDVGSASPRATPAPAACSRSASPMAPPAADQPAPPSDPSPWSARRPSYRPTDGGLVADAHRLVGGAGPGRLTVSGGVGGVAPVAIAATVALTLGRSGEPLTLSDMRTAMVQMQLTPSASIVNPVVTAARLVEACLTFTSFRSAFTDASAGGVALRDLEALKADATRVVEWTTPLLRCYQLALQAAASGTPDAASAAVVAALEGLASVCGDKMATAMSSDGHGLKVAVTVVDALATTLGSAPATALCLGSRAFNAITARLSFEAVSAWLAELDAVCADAGLPPTQGRKAAASTPMSAVVRTVYSMVCRHAEASRLVARSSAPAPAVRARSVLAAAAITSGLDSEAEDEAYDPAHTLSGLGSPSAAPTVAPVLSTATSALPASVVALLSAAAAAYTPASGPAGLVPPGVACVQGPWCHKYLMGGCAAKAHGAQPAGSPASAAARAAVAALPCPVSANTCGNACDASGRTCPFLGGRVDRTPSPRAPARAPTPAAGHGAAGAGRGGGGVGRGGAARPSARAVLLAAVGLCAAAPTAATPVTLRGVGQVCVVSALVDSGSEADILSAAALARIRALAPTAVRDLDVGTRQAFANVTLAGVGAAPTKPLAFVEVRVAADGGPAAPAAWHVVAVVDSLPGAFDMILSARRLTASATLSFNETAVSAAASGSPSPMARIVAHGAGPTAGVRLLAGVAASTTTVDDDYFPGGLDGEPAFYGDAYYGYSFLSGKTYNTVAVEDNTKPAGAVADTVSNATMINAGGRDAGGRDAGGPEGHAFVVAGAFVAGYDPTDPASRESYFVLGEDDDTMVELQLEETLSPASYVGTWREAITMGDVYNNLADSQKAEFDAMLNRHADVFRVPRAGEMSNVPPVVLTRRPGTEHITAHGHTRPVRAALVDALKAEVAAYVAAGILVPVPFSNRAAFVSNVVVAWRASGKIRMCLDCVQLNRVLEPATYPLPRLDESIASFGAVGNTVFSSCDMKFGFHQLAVAPESRHLLRVAIPGFAHHFEYACLPFGVASAPQTFQRAADAAFAAPLATGDCVLYLDDLGFGAPDWRTQMLQVDGTLTAAALANVHLNASKCHFLASSITFLGWNFTAQGRAPTVARRQGLTDMASPGQTPTAAKARLQLQSAGALFNWCRDFVPNFALHMAPLYRLSKKGVVWDWTDECEAAFVHVRTTIANADCLAPLDFTYPLVVRTDASDFGYGGVLMTGHPAALKPAAFCSARFSPAQVLAWSTIMKEAKAIHFCVNHWRREVGSSAFVVASDHKNLTWKDTVNTDPQVARWARDLQRFTYTRVYIRGEDNGLADAMSRLIAPAPSDAADRPAMVSAAGVVDFAPREGSAGAVFLGETLTPAAAAAHWRALGHHQREEPPAAAVPFLALASVTRGSARASTNTSLAHIEPVVLDVTSLAHIEPVVLAAPEDSTNTSLAHIEPVALAAPERGTAGQHTVVTRAGRAVSFASASTSAPRGQLPSVGTPAGTARGAARSASPAFSFDFLGETAPVPAQTPAVTVTPIDGLTVDLLDAVARAQAQLQPANGGPRDFDVAYTSAVSAGVPINDAVTVASAAAEFNTVFNSDVAVLYPRGGHAPLLHVVGVDGVARLYVPANVMGLTVRRQLVAVAHNEAHFHAARNVQRLRDAHVDWPRLPTDCSEYAATCLACQRYKGPHGVDADVGSALRLPPPTAFGARVHLDLLGPMPLSRLSGNGYVLVAIDVFSRFVTLTCMKDAAASTTFTAFDVGWVGLFGFPEGVTSDGGSHFKGDFADALGRSGVSHHVTTPYHPQSNGIVERVIRVVCEALKTRCNGASDQWELHVPSIQLSINLAPNRSIGVAPADVVLTFTPRSRLDASVGRRAAHSIDGGSAQGTALKSRMAAQSTFERAMKRHLSAQDTAAEAYDAAHTPTEFPVGSYVFVHYTPSTGSNKLHSNWRGPWRIVEMDAVGAGNYYSVLDPQFDRPHRVHVSRLREARLSADNLDSEALFWATVRPDTSMVDAVLDHAGKGRRLVFKVKWHGWDPIYATWQQAASLAKVAVVIAYAAQHRIKLSH